MLGGSRIDAVLSLGYTSQIKILVGAGLSTLYRLFILINPCEPDHAVRSLDDDCANSCCDLLLRSCLVDSTSSLISLNTLGEGSMSSSPTPNMQKRRYRYDQTHLEPFYQCRGKPTDGEKVPGENQHEHHALYILSFQLKVLPRQRHYHQQNYSGGMGALRSVVLGGISPHRVR